MPLPKANQQHDVRFGFGGATPRLLLLRDGSRSSSRGIPPRAPAFDLGDPPASIRPVTHSKIITTGTDDRRRRAHGPADDVAEQ